MFDETDDLAGMFDTVDGFAFLATYRAGGVGGGIEIAAMPTQPDAVQDIFGQPAVSATSSFLIQAADIAQPVAGDTLEIQGATYTVQGVPRRDDTRALWRLEARPS